MIKWKSVKKELPKESGNVLVVLRNHAIVVNYCKNKGFNEYDSVPKREGNIFEDVTHWAYINYPVEENDL